MNHNKPDLIEQHFMNKIDIKFSFFRNLPEGHYYIRNRWGWYMAVVGEWLMSKGIRIIHYGQIRKPYTFWKRLFSFKWLFHFKLYFPIRIIRYKTYDKNH